MNRVPLNPPVYRSGKDQKCDSDNLNPETGGYKRLYCLYCDKSFPIVNHLTAMGEYWRHLSECAARGDGHDAR